MDRLVFQRLPSAIDTPAGRGQQWLRPAIGYQPHQPLLNHSPSLGRVLWTSDAHRVAERRGGRRCSTIGRDSNTSATALWPAPQTSISATTLFGGCASSTAVVPHCKTTAVAALHCARGGPSSV